MGSEVLIYAYGVVCLSMLAFNLIYSGYLRGGAARSDRRTRRIGAIVSAALDESSADGALPHGHSVRMEDLLSHVNGLIALDNCLSGMEPGRAERYLRALTPVFTRLAGVYCRREETQGAYFCYFIYRHGADLGEGRLALARATAPYVGRKSIYCRINALKALCTLGDADTLLDSLLYLGQDEEAAMNLDGKVIVETLMGFRGGAGELADKLWSRFERFPVNAQRVLLDYIRFSGGDYGDEMLDILLDTGRDKELRLSAIRYFGRHVDERARSVLIGFVSDRDPGKWEYAAISATSLASYPGEDTFGALAQAMRSPNWYVRYNCAASLERLGFTYDDLVGRGVASDRYAREMLTYRLEMRGLNSAAERRRKEAATV